MLFSRSSRKFKIYLLSQFSLVYFILIAISFINVVIVALHITVSLSFQIKLVLVSHRLLNSFVYKRAVIFSN